MPEVVVRDATGQELSRTHVGVDNPTGGEGAAFRLPPLVERPTEAIVIAAGDLQQVNTPVITGSDTVVVSADGIEVTADDGALTLMSTCAPDDVLGQWLTGLRGLSDVPDFALLMTADCLLTANDIRRLLTVLHDNPGVGIVFPCAHTGRIWSPPTGARAVAVRANMLLAAERRLRGDQGTTIQGTGAAFWQIAELAAYNHYRIYGFEVVGAGDPIADNRLCDRYPDPQVSFVIPAYNAERWVVSAVQSAFAQEEVTVEVVVVNDGSTDGTVDRLVELRREVGPRLIIMTQPNSGPSAARNYGVRRALSDVLIFLDADDIAPPNRAQLTLQALADADICIGQVHMFEEDADPSQAIPIGRIAPPTPHTIVGNAGGFHAGAAATHRRLHEELGVWFDEELDGCEDYEFAIAATAAGARWACIEEPVLWRRRVSTSRRNRHVDRALLRRWCCYKHRKFLHTYALEWDGEPDEDGLLQLRAEALNRARAQRSMAARKRIPKLVEPDNRFADWHGFPGPAYPPGEDEPIRVLMHLFAARGEGLEAFASYLARAMPRGAVEWMFTVSHGCDRSGKALEEYGEVRVLDTQDDDRAWWDFERAVLDFRPHLIHSSYRDGSEWAQRVGVPLLVTVHGITGGQLYGSEYADEAVAVSPAALYGADRVILSGIEPPEWPDKRRQGLFAWCGRLDAEVKPELFLDALARVRDARGIVIGTANRREWDCRAEIERRGLSDRVQYLGQLPPEEARQRLAECDGIVIAADHSFGFAVAEAMCAGVFPIVTQGRGYQVEMVGEWGQVCEPTAEGLAKGIRCVLSDENRDQRRRPMAEDARRRFAAKRMAYQYLETYERLLMPPLDIFVVAYNGGKSLEVTRAAIKHFETHTWVPYRLVLVDNGSTDGGRTWDYFRRVRDEYDTLYGEGVRCVAVRSEENLGAPNGRNLAFRYSVAPFFAPFDDDMMVPPGWAGPLMRVMRTRPQCAVVAPWWEGYEPHLRGRQLQPWNVGGTAAIFRREAVLAASELDQPGVLFVEPFASLQGRADTDLICRLIEAGYEVLIEPAVECHHLGGLVRKRPGMTRRFADLSGIEKAQELWREKWAAWGVRRR